MPQITILLLTGISLFILATTGCNQPESDVKKELLERVASTDKRAKNPILTQRGQQTLKRALPAVETADKKYFQGLTKSEQKTLMTLFQKLCGYTTFKTLIS